MYTSTILQLNIERLNLDQLFLFWSLKFILGFCNLQGRPANAAVQESREVRVTVDVVLHYTYTCMSVLPSLFFILFCKLGSLKPDSSSGYNRIITPQTGVKPELRVHLPETGVNR
jgi:hypothetical protein